MTVRLLLRLVVGTAALIAGMVVFSGVAAADNCSSPGDCEETGGYNGAIAVVGGAAAVAAAAAAAIANTPEGEETDLAIVQVSTDTLDIDPETPGQLTLTGWHVGDDRQLRRVPMSLWIEVPPAMGVAVEPASGTGELVANVRVDESTLRPDVQQVELVAWGDHNGKRASETVTVNLGGDLELRLTEDTGGG